MRGVGTTRLGTYQIYQSLHFIMTIKTIYGLWVVILTMFKQCLSNTSTQKNDDRKRGDLFRTLTPRSEYKVLHVGCMHSGTKHQMGIRWARHWVLHNFSRFPFSSCTSSFFGSSSFTPFCRQLRNNENVQSHLNYSLDPLQICT